MIESATVLHRDRSFLLIVDVQERLTPSIAEAPKVVEKTGILMQAARRLDIPVLATEQYTKGLGLTVPDLREQLEVSERMEKVHFDATREPEIRAQLAAFDRDQAVITGIESHVCVLQTALGCLDMGVVPYIPADAVASRDPSNRELALSRLAQTGGRTVATEMVLFEWLERAGTDVFRELLPLIR